MKILRVLTVILFCAPFLLGQWSKSPALFDATGIARNGDSFWVCGAKASIASSVDGGNHWLLRTSKEGGGTLLSIRWLDEKVGAAGGTGGLILLSTDGGESWKQIPTSFSEPVLDLSFIDSAHGIVLTTASVLYTADGGTTWRAALPSSNSDLSRFKFVLAVAALDEKHAAVLVKEGPAQYYAGRLVTTSDSGATWKTTDIEHTTLNNLLVTRGHLWLVGTEVVEREKQGGHAVPVTFHSTDAMIWERGPRPLIDTNYACRPEGCLMWNGAWLDTFVQNGKIHTFPPTPNLSVQWSATDSRICTLAPDLQCADTKIVQSLPQRGGPAPQLAATELRATTADLAGKCIRCDYPHIIVSEKFEGKATVKLTILARPDGTVSSVELVSSPNPEVGDRLSQAASTWVFYPVFRDGVAAPTKRTLDLTVNVLKSR